MLNVWKFKSLQERCVLFHRRFPDKRISPTALTKLYATKQIRYRLPTFKVKLTSKQLASQHDNRSKVFPELLRLE